MEKEKYINSINLNIDTDFPYLVLEVIGNSSYPQISHFGKCFKEKTGYSPKAYREMENSH